MEQEKFQFDPSLLSYEEFIDYFFTAPTGELWDVDPSGISFVMPVVTRPRTVVLNLTRFCNEFHELANQLSLESLDHGVNGMLSAAHFELQSALWDNSVDLDERIRCIRSMYRVFADFVAHCKVEVLVGCFYMWWDEVCSSFWFKRTYERQSRSEDYNLLDKQDRALADAMYETLVQILTVDDVRTKSCALHGLGHLHHPAVRETVQKYIDSHKTELTEQDLRWLEECRDGTVM